MDPLDLLGALSNLLCMIWISRQDGDITNDAIPLDLYQVDPENIATGIADCCSQAAKRARGVAELHANRNGMRYVRLCHAPRLAAESSHQFSTTDTVIPPLLLLNIHAR
jgi:hypothetical protein